MEYQGFESGSRSLSVRQLTLIFMGAVALCALFFAMGFVVGANEHNSSSGPMVEQVAPANRDASLAPPPSRTDTIPNDGQPGAEAESASAPVSSDDAKPSSASQSSQSQTKQQGSGTAYSSDGGLNGTVTEAMGVVDTHASASRSQKSAQASSRRSVPAADAAFSSKDGIIIQVAALREMQDAKSLVDVLKSRNYPAFIVTPAQSRNNDGIYRVQVGPFSSKTQAEKTRQRLAQQGFKTFYKR